MPGYEAVLGYFPAERVLLAALVAPMRYAGPREAVLRAWSVELRLHPLHRRPRPRRGRQLLRRLQAQELIASLPAEDLGITPLRFDNAFYCRLPGHGHRQGHPHPDSEHVALSGQVRSMLAAGCPRPSSPGPRSPSC